MCVTDYLLPLLLIGLASGSPVEVKLNEELTIPAFAGPDRHLMVRPVDSPSDQITLNISLALLDAEVNEADNKVTLGAWMHLEWIDHRVSWSGGNVKSTRVLPSRIWTPDLGLYNRVPVTSEWVYPTPAVVYPTGRVIYVPPVSFTVRCERNQTDDHDRIICPFKIGSWTHSVEEMDLVMISNTLDTDFFISNGHWAVESTSLAREEESYSCCEEKYVHLQGEVVLKPQRS